MSSDKIMRMSKRVKNISAKPNDILVKSLGNNLGDIPKANYTYLLKESDIKAGLNDKILVSHWNVNSVNARANGPHLSSYLNSKDFDIICFNETKLSSKKFISDKWSENELWSNKYHQYWTLSVSRNGYSGTSLLTKQKPLNVTFGIGDDEFDAEGRMITASSNDFI